MATATLTVGPLAENTYLYWRGDEGVIIDPGDEPERIKAALAAAGFTPRAIVLTHAHFDHLGAARELAESLGLGVFLHKDELFLYELAPEAAKSWGFEITPPPDPAGFLAEGDLVLDLLVLHLPGHSPGHIGLYSKELDLIFTGDVLFRGAIGRYDFPGSDKEKLFSSLARLLTLPPETRVLPGHGEETTIARERRENPYLKGLL